MVILSSAAGEGATLFAPETFGDGGAPTANGWNFKDGGVFAEPGDAGVGDHALLYGAAGNLHFHNGDSANTDLEGSYITVGVTALRFKARHTGVGSTVDLRVYVFDPTVDSAKMAMSNTVVSITPGDTSWQIYEIPLLAADLTGIGTTPAAILAGVEQLGLRHDPAGVGPTNQGTLALPTDIYFDDVELVPEPAAATLCGLSAIAVALRRRR